MAWVMRLELNQNYYIQPNPEGYLNGVLPPFYLISNMKKVS